jgi:hypothetical protein
VLDVAMAQEELDGPRILLIVGELKAAAMPELMRVHGEAKCGNLARVGHHLPHARVGERTLALREKDVRRVGGARLFSRRRARISAAVNGCVLGRPRLRRRT